MHTIDLGIWVHLLTAVAYKLDKTVRYGGVLSAAKVAGVWKKLEDRAAQMSSDDSMLTLNAYKAKYMKILLDQKNQLYAGSANKQKKSKKLQAWEHHVLMLVSLCPGFVPIM
jgi:hypothetical protein